jgi:hypothetical protein
VRSQQVYHALTHIPNRFALCRLTSVAIKKLHKSHSRPEETINNVLRDIDRYKSRRSPGAPDAGEGKIHNPMNSARGTAPENSSEETTHSDLVFVGY